MRRDLRGPRFAFSAGPTGNWRNGCIWVMKPRSSWLTAILMAGSWHSREMFTADTRSRLRRRNLAHDDVRDSGGSKLPQLGISSGKLIERPFVRYRDITGQSLPVLRCAEFARFGNFTLLELWSGH